MSIEYYTLRPEHAAAYKAIRLRALHDAPTAFTSSWETQREAPDSFFIGRVTPAPDNFVIGAFDGDTLIATGGGFVDPELKRNHIGYIVGMWVDETYRRRGIARELVRRVMADLECVERVTHLQLSVTENNAGAFKLYADLGFAVWGREPDALHADGQLYDEVHMARTL